MKLRLSSKIMAGFAIMLLLTAVVGYNGISGMYDQEEEYQLIASQSARLSSLVWQARTAALEQISSVRGFVIFGEKQFYQGFYDQIKIFDAVVKELEIFATDSQSQKFLSDLKEYQKKYKANGEAVMKLAQEKKVPEAMATCILGRPHVAQIKKIADDWAAYVEQTNAKKIDLAVAHTQASVRNKMITIVIAIITGVAVSLYLSRNISRPVIAITGIAEEVSQKILTKEVPQIKTGDEIEVLAAAVTKMVANLKEVITQVQHSADNVLTTSVALKKSSEEGNIGSNQIASAIDELAKGSSEQNRSVNEAVNMVEQLRKSIDSIASGAQDQARNVAVTSEAVTSVAHNIDATAKQAESIKVASNESLKAALEGETAVKKSVEGMGRIHEAVISSSDIITELGKQSEQIGQIIQVIDDIAEQTNLLALNAAIEAARAGEHGKGFAVVADEVRKLAERSGKATKEIALLINTIQQNTDTAVKSMEKGTSEVNNGVEVVKEAGRALSQILSTVELTRQSSEEVAAAVEQIADKINQLSQAAENVAAITEENTAMTEEMAANSIEVADAIQSIASIIEESTASAEEISAATSQVNDSTAMVTQKAGTLSQMAADLQNMVAAFKLK